MFFFATILCKNVNADILYSLKYVKLNYTETQVNLPYQTRPQGDAKGLHLNYYTGPFRITKHTKIQMKNKTILNVWKLSDLKAGRRHQ